MTSIIDVYHVGSVDLYDESHGVFGELIDPVTVQQAFRLSDNVGPLDDPGTASAVRALRSLTQTPALPINDTSATTSSSSRSASNSVEDDIIVEFDNATSFTLVIRFIDEQGKAAETSVVDGFASGVRVARPGHLFILTTRRGTEASTVPVSSELLIGAYRTLQALPSGSPHSILLEEEEQLALAETEPEDHEEERTNGPTESSWPHFFLEFVLANDDTRQDALMVAAAMLDPVGALHHDADHLTSSISKTLETLSEIVSNLLLHPENPKFRSLRLSNTKVRHVILASHGACYFLLHILGFARATGSEEKEEVDDDDHWTVSEEQARSMTELLQRSAHWLRLLQSRCRSDFVEELAPPVPWQSPVLATAASLRIGPWLHNTDYSTHFITPDERWARTDRRRGGGAARRAFRPGYAPSSGGTWGR